MVLFVPVIFQEVWFDGAHCQTEHFCFFGRIFFGKFRSFFRSADISEEVRIVLAEVRTFWIFSAEVQLFWNFSAEVRIFLQMSFFLFWIAQGVKTTWINYC